MMGLGMTRACYLSMLLLGCAAAAEQPDLQNQAELSCLGAPVLLQANSSGGVREVFQGFPGSFGGNLTAKSGTPLRLNAVSPADACSTVKARSLLHGSAVLVARGGCTFLEKGALLQNAGAAFMIVYNNEPGCFLMGSNTSDAEQLHLTIPAVSVSQEAGRQLLAMAAAGAHVSVWLPHYAAVDPSAAVLWLMAVCTIVGGALWAQKDQASIGRLQSGSGTSHASLAKQEVLMLTTGISVGFIIFASAMLLLLFFFLGTVMTYILVGLFCLAGVQGMTPALVAIMHTWLPPWGRKCNQVICCGKIARADVLATGISIVTAVVWAVFRNTLWAWVLQDVMGICVMLLILRQLRLPNIKVACVLLPLAFFYDIWWVFLQPEVTGGDSVMVAVATGGASHEPLPMLLKVPRFLHFYQTGFQLLGFGDVVLPGVLVVFTRLWDYYRSHTLWRGYFLPTVCGYGVGLLLTYLALLFNIGGDQGQPALLYLVPCTLGVVLVLSLYRGDLKSMWRGNVTARSVGDPSDGMEEQALLSNASEEV